MSTGKQRTGLSKLLALMQTAEGAFRAIKGLHHQRWSALTNADAIVRLAMIEVEPRHDHDQAHA
jgi:hypothetical protein